MKYALGLAIAFGMGALCRWLDLPAPAPPKILGVLIIVAMTVGYVTANALLPPLPSSPVPADATRVEKPTADPSEPTR